MKHYLICAVCIYVFVAIIALQPDTVWDSAHFEMVYVCFVFVSLIFPFFFSSFCFFPIYIFGNLVNVCAECVLNPYYFESLIRGSESVWIVISIYYYHTSQIFSSTPFWSLLSIQGQFLLTEQFLTVSQCVCVTFFVVL